MRMLVKTSYHGGQFMGFQIQHHERTVQYEFERILKRMHQTFVRIHPSSRTDKGVHAIEQYFHFDTPLNIKPDKWEYAFNSALPKDIHVQSVEQIDEDFHCRYDCVGKK
ncbi:tRNA pseudouridine synthase A, partial [Mammaliicoccus sciuri]